MDLIRVTAVICVISVHFFMYTGFYDQPMAGKKMFLLCTMRTFFSCCVPLFLILSGYLMGEKKLEKSYYRGLSSTLATYVLAGAACTVYCVAFLHISYSPAEILFRFLNFSAANYAWYVEMYIGLFLLIPFLNLIYRALDSKGKKDALLLTMVVLTVLPTFTNSFNLADPAWWAAPAASGITTTLLPKWWIGVYPVTYYFTGRYLREYGLRLKSGTIALLLALTTLGFGAFNYWQSYGAGFITGSYANWGGFQPFVTTVLLFSLLSRVKGERVPIPARYLLWKGSELCLGAYLVSYIFDTAFYPRLNAAVPLVPDRLYWFPVMVACIFLCSMLLSLALHRLQALLGRLAAKAAEAVRKNPGRAGTIAFLLCFAAVIAFALWKCPFGFGSSDDAFYLTVPHRLVLGDTLFADEWHVSQMSGLITFPLVWLYHTVTGSTDGILLASRYAYVVFHALVSIAFYRCVRKHGTAAKAAALSYFMFTPFDIMAMSYNTMAMDFILLSGALLAAGGTRKHWVCSGLCLAAAVMCCPYFATAYFLYAALTGIHALLGRGKARQAGIFHPSRLLWLTLGVAAVSAVFAAYVLSSCGIRGLLAGLPNILTDPEHPASNPVGKLRRALALLIDCHPLFKFVLVSYLLVLAAMLADRNRKNHRAFYLIVSCVLTLVNLAMFYPRSTELYYNMIMFPLIYVGLTAYLLCDHKPRTLFAGIFAAGLIYTAAVTMGSNQYVYAIGMASAVTNTASFLFLGQLLREMRERPDKAAYATWLRRGAAGAAAAAVTVLLLMQLQVKKQHCFVDDSPSAQTYQIQEGPARGIWTAEYKGMVYEHLNSELQYYKTVPTGKLLILCERTWCYLAADPMRYATFSAWISGENQTALNRLAVYYRVNPDKVPDYIYLSKTSKFEDPGAIVAAAQAQGYTLQESERSYYLSRP